MGEVDGADATLIVSWVGKFKILRSTLTISVARSKDSAPGLRAVLPTGRPSGVAIVLFTRMRNGII